VESKLLNKTALPSICDATDFGLSDKSNNTKKRESLLKSKTKDIPELNPNSEVYSCFLARPEGNTNIALINNKSNMLVFYADLKEHRSPIISNKSVTQTSIWRNYTDLGTKGFATKLFEYLLQHFGTIISDDIQTHDGKRFWEEKLAEAEVRGAPVGLVNEKVQGISWKPSGVPILDWLEEVDAWGWEKTHLRFIIKK